MNRRLLKFLSLLIVLTLFAAACGDDDDGETAGGTTDTTEATGSTDEQAQGGGNGPAGVEVDWDALQAEAEKIEGQIEEVSGNTTRGITEDTIRVGGVTTLKDPSGIEPFPGQCEGAKARFERANREGGVNGRKIEYLPCRDDGADRTKNLQGMQAAVEDDEVFAVLPVISVGFFSGDYLTQNHVPYFGFAFMPDYCGYERPFAFGIGGAGACNSVDGKTWASQSIADQAMQALDKEGAKFATIAEDSANGKTGNAVVAIGVEEQGGEVVFDKNPIPPPTAPPITDWTPLANEIIDANPDVVVLTTSAGPVIGLSGALRAAGFSGEIMNFIFSSDAVFASPQVAQPLDKIVTIVTSTVGPGTESESAKQVMEDLEAVGWTKGLTTGALQGYGSADFFIEALKKTPEPVTTEALANTINKGFVYPGVGDAICPSHWPIGHLTSNSCGSAIRLDAANKTYIELLPLTQSPIALIDTPS